MTGYSSPTIVHVSEEDMSPDENALRYNESALTVNVSEPESDADERRERELAPLLVGQNDTQNYIHQDQISPSGDTNFYRMFGTRRRFESGALLEGLGEALNRVPSFSRQLPRTFTELGTFDEDAIEHIENTNAVGTFRGVVVPTCEFAWSVLIFIRFGFIVGEAGVLVAIFTVLMCALCVAVTVTSISAIATNGIPRGGVYSILTKSLGNGIGCAISILYYLGVAMFITVECVGSVQGLQEAVPRLLITPYRYLDQVILGAASLVLLAVPVYIGRKVVHGIGIFFLCVLMLSFLAVFSGLFVAPKMGSFGGQVTGLRMETLQANLMPREGFEFSSVLAFMVPCFVGIYSGVNNAQNLANPFASIPKGGLLAIATSSGLYISLILLIGSVATRELILSDFMLIAEIAWPTSVFAIVGVYMVGIGSAFQCLRISSQVLQSIAKGGLLPPLRKLGLHKLWNEEPRPAILFTVILAFPFIFTPDLEVLAIIVTMCFLLCYGSTNFACFTLSLVQTPSWRPMFRFTHWSVSLLGVVYCLVLMFEVNFMAATFALFASILLAYSIQVKVINRYGHGGRLGHGVRGLLFHLAVGHLVSLEREEVLEKSRLESFMNSDTATVIDTDSVSSFDKKSVPASAGEASSTRLWRPQILAFIRLRENGEISYPRLLSFISQLQASGGVCILASIITNADIGESSLSRTYAHGYGGFGHNHNRASSNYAEDITPLLSANLDQLLSRRKTMLQKTMLDESIDGFAKVFVAPSVRVGQSILLQTVGIGELTPNTVVISWPETKSFHSNLRSVRELQDLWAMTRRLGLSTIICKGLPTFPSNQERMDGSIDVWWIVQDGQLLLLLAYILQRHRTWKKCSIRLFAVASEGDDIESIETELDMYLTLMRINVDSISVIPISRPSGLGTTAGSSSTSTPMPREERRRVSRMRESVMADVLTREMNENVPRTEDATSGKRRQLPPETASFVKTWIHDVENLSAIDRRDFFLKAHTAAQLKREIDRYSAYASLVILNLPSPEVDSEGSDIPSATRTGMYMELVEFLTGELERTALVQTGHKVKDILSVFSF